MSVQRAIRKLNDGSSIPKIGFGTGTGLFGSECSELVLSALDAGYRYLDAAQMYHNSGSIGTALAKWKGGSRSDVYITTKFGDEGLSDEQLNTLDPRKILDEQLMLMGVDHVDLYLIHAPIFAKPNLKECWKTMEALQKEGLTKSIGVSNFREEDLKEIAQVWTIPPAVNQIEYHPYVFHSTKMLSLKEYMDNHKITLIGYGPLSTLFRSKDGPVDSVVRQIAEKHEATEAQVLLAWESQYGGGVVLTTSRDFGRQKEQLDALVEVHLSDEELARITEAGEARFFRNAWTDLFGESE